MTDTTKQSSTETPKERVEKPQRPTVAPEKPPAATPNDPLHSQKEQVTPERLDISDGSVPPPAFRGKPRPRHQAE